MSKVTLTTRRAWMERHPVVCKFIEEHPNTWAHVPAFSIWPDVKDIKNISDHQREQLGKALTGRICILGGSPGTGKTYCAAQLVRCLLDSSLVGEHEIGIGAPTGIASVRITKMMNNLGIHLRARTCHSILGVGQSSQTSGWIFKHNSNNPLPYRVMILDEPPMFDNSLMRSIFAARMSGCHFLFVGDVNQLGPVAAGAPFRDMIAAGLPYGELTEIQRNSGGIVEACKAIRECKPWVNDAGVGQNENLVFVEEEAPEGQIEAILSTINTAADNGMDPIWDCQILCAVNDRSPMSRKVLNKVLQDYLNPGQGETGSFRLRDKVVCLKNGFYIAAEGHDQSDDAQTNGDGAVFVANGELAQVIDIDPGKFMLAKLESPARVVKVPLFKSKDQDEASDDSKDNDSKGSAGNWDLAYALSVHKSQGSEFPLVCVVLDSYAGAKMVCDRAWIYTAISRAKTKCFLIGVREVAERFCKTAKLDNRKTFLREMIAVEMFKKEASEI